MIKKIFPLVYTKNINLALKKKSVLCLENFYFHIFKMKVENVINKEDRILKIEDHLEIIFPKYNSIDFILNYEFLEKEEDYEQLIIYLLNLNALKKINITVDNKYQLLAILPSFFIVREFKIGSNFYNFDISENSLVISKYCSGKLEDINSFDSENLIIDNKNESSSYTNIVNSFLTNIEKSYFIIFTGNKINVDDLDLENRIYKFFDIDNIDFRKYPNFLPKKLQQKYILYSLNFRYLLGISILTVLSLIIFIFLYYKIDSFEKKLEELEVASSLLEEENTGIRKELAELEKSKLELEKEKNKIFTSSFKISDFLMELKYIIPKNINILSIEYDGQKILSLTGRAQNLNDVNLFLNNIQNSENIKLENYDYILKKDFIIEFKFELSL